jgi:hypothetical protein
MARPRAVDRLPHSGILRLTVQPKVRELLVVTATSDRIVFIRLLAARNLPTLSVPEQEELR